MIDWTRVSLADCNGIGGCHYLQSLQRVHAFFRNHGEDPSVIAPDFFQHWIEAGKSPDAIFRIATNAKES